MDVRSHKMRRGIFLLIFVKKVFYFFQGFLFAVITALFLLAQSPVIAESGNAGGLFEISLLFDGRVEANFMGDEHMVRRCIYSRGCTFRGK